MATLGKLPLRHISINPGQFLIMKPILFVAGCCLVFASVKAQQKEVDSLLKELSTHTKEDTVRLNLLNSLTYNYYNIDPDKGLSTGDDAIALAQKLDNKAKLAEAYRSKGINQWARGEYPSALELYGKAQQLFESLNNRKGMMQTYNNTGVVYMYMSDYPMSLSYFLKAVPIAEELKNKTGMANTCTNIGLVYKNLSNYPKALEYYQKAYRLFAELDNKQGLGSVLGNMGTVYDLNNKPDSALLYYQRGLVINKEIGNKRGIASDLVNIGIVHQSNGRFIEAYDYLTQSQKIYEEVGDKNNLIVVLASIGATLTEASQADFEKMNINAKDRFEYALSLQKTALALAREIEAPDEEYQVWESISNTYEKKKDNSNALAAYKNFVSLRDSVVNDEKKQEVARKEMQFEFDKKAAVTSAIHQSELAQQKTVKYAVIAGSAILLFGLLISFLFYRRKKEADTRKQEAELKAEISDTEMKALRAQMNPHFIFNSLNSISDFITKNNTASADQYLTRFAKLMRMILENSEKKEIALSDELKALELYMQLESLRMKNKFSYEIVTDASIDKENTLVPPLILQPFVENSIWHGIAPKEGNGKIEVNIRKEDSMINCTISDNGIGLAASAEKNTMGKKSLGMKITMARIDILNRLKKSNASVQLKELKAGTAAHIKLPLELSI